MYLAQQPGEFDHRLLSVRTVASRLMRNMTFQFLLPDSRPICPRGRWHAGHLDLVATFNS